MNGKGKLMIDCRYFSYTLFRAIFEDDFNESKVIKGQ